MAQPRSRAAFERLTPLVRPVRLKAFVRLHRKAYQALDVIPSDTRFCGADWPEGVIYAANRLQTAIAETLIRNRFDGRATRRLEQDEVSDRNVSILDAHTALHLLDLRGDGAIAYGVPAAVLRATNHRSGRVFARRLHDYLPDVDGILFPSRLLDGSVNVAVFERASRKVSVRSTRPLTDLRETDAALRALRIELI
jgi:hypothetical protein